MLNIEGIYVPRYVLGGGLRLKGYEAFTYSLIAFFSPKNGFYCSENDVAQLLGCRRECVSRVLQTLLDKGLIEKSSERHKPGNTYCYYVKKSHIDMCEKVTSHGAKKSHQNKEENIIIHKNTHKYYSRN